MHSQYNEDKNIRNPRILDVAPYTRRKSPIMVEFGDPQIKEVDIAQALESGMNIIKFRMAYSTKSQKDDLMDKLSIAAERTAKKKKIPICPVATCASLKTWVKRCGLVKVGCGNAIHLQKDNEVILTCDALLIDKCNCKKIYVDYPHLSLDVAIGTEISIGLDNVVMYCIEIIDNMSIKCLVSKEGIVSSFHVTFFRQIKHTTPTINEVDLNILKFCVWYQISMIIVYYAQNGEMIQTIKSHLKESKFKPLIYSGISDQAGLDNLDTILKESDGIILARHFLLQETDRQTVFRMGLIQKWVAGKCLRVGKPLFITTVLESVLRNGAVSDSDLSDVTNALMDGVSGFMLRNCHDMTYTLQAISDLHNLCCQVEPLCFDNNLFWRLMREPHLPLNAAEATIAACVMAANQMAAKVLVISTVCGRTARALMFLHPSCLIITVGTRKLSAKMLYTCRNIVPLVFEDKAPAKEWAGMENARIQFAVDIAISKKWLIVGDIYIALQRSKSGHTFCDMFQGWTVTKGKQYLVECTYEDESVSDDAPCCDKI